MVNLASAKQLCAGEEGATMVEYALMLGFITAVCVGAVAALGIGVNALFVVPGL